MENERIYVGAGAIVQSLWNEITDKQQNYVISDVDIIYYNTDDLTEDDEEITKKSKEKLESFHLK